MPLIRQCSLKLLYSTTVIRAGPASTTRRHEGGGAKESGAGGEWGGRGVGREERNRVVGVREGGSTGRSCLCGCFWKETNAD